MSKRDENCEVSFEFNGRKVSLSSQEFTDLSRAMSGKKRKQKPLTASQRDTQDLFCSFVRQGAQGGKA